MLPTAMPWAKRYPWERCPVVVLHGSGTRPPPHVYTLTRGTPVRDKDRDTMWGSSGKRPTTAHMSFFERQGTASTCVQARPPLHFPKQLSSVRIGSPTGATMRPEMPQNSVSRFSCFPKPLSSVRIVPYCICSNNTHRTPQATGAEGRSACRRPHAGSWRVLF